MLRYFVLDANVLIIHEWHYTKFILQMKYKTMAQERDRWTALVNAVMKLRVP